MIKKFFLLFIIFFLITNIPSYASNKDKIIQNLQKVNNLSFNFKQKIKKKVEEGNCIIKYPKLIFCKYKNKKIMVSDGKSLVIKNQKNKQSYFYSLKRTPLYKILDKKNLINEIKNANINIEIKKNLSFSLNYNNNIIKIIFDKKNYNLIGWVTEDIYQNKIYFEINDLQINQKIDEKQFKLPKIN